MEIVWSTFDLIKRFVYELIFFIVVDTAVKKLLGTRYPFSRYLFSRCEQVFVILHTYLLTYLILDGVGLKKLPLSIAPLCT